jgi:hypothetical protein
MASESRLRTEVKPASKTRLFRYAIDRLLLQVSRSMAPRMFLLDGALEAASTGIFSLRPTFCLLTTDNRGPSAAHNRGCASRAGTLIAIQASGDLCAPNYLESLYDFARRNEGCGMGFANGAYLSGQEHNRQTIIPTGKSRRLA